MTSGSFDGDLGGLEGADAQCQAAAGAEDLKGVWKAWLSVDGGPSPNDRFTRADVPYRLVTGEDVAQDYDDLVDEMDSGQQGPIDVTEQGARVGVDERAWTGTASDGTPTNADCSGWTTNDSAANGTVGRRTFSTASATWTATADESCDGARRIYCFEQ